jgi:aspartyl protease family protein
MQQRSWVWILVAGIALTGLVLYLMERFPDALESDWEQSRLVYLLLWLSLLGGSAIMHFRARPGSALRSAAIWIGIGLVLVIGYSYRDVFSDVRARVMGELLPEQGTVHGSDSVSFRGREDGHFHVEALVEGTRLRFLVDTGSTDVVLSPADAQRLGIDLQRLDYSLVSETANGEGRGAPIQLRNIEIGPIRLIDLPAVVNQAPMSSSLLGMSFLNRLGGYDVRDGTLTLWR